VGRQGRHVVEVNASSLVGWSNASLVGCNTERRVANKTCLIYDIAPRMYKYKGITDALFVHPNAGPGVSPTTLLNEPFSPVVHYFVCGVYSTYSGTILYDILMMCGSDECHPTVDAQLFSLYFYQKIHSASFSHYLRSFWNTGLISSSLVGGAIMALWNTGA
jgi:hypothetical protein